MRISYFAKTDTGIIRKENQDAFGVNPEKDFYVVCDGMGGGAAGDFASKCAVEVILKSFDHLNEKQINEVTGGYVDTEIMRPVASIMLANRMLHNLTQKYPKLAGMGTTAAAARFESETSLLHMYHTGDSRIYRIRGGVIELLTKDHSKVNELIDEGKMREEDVKTAEMQSMITRALGTGSTVKVDYKAVAVKPGDYYIMCTDGLNGEIEDAVIKGIVDIHKGNLTAIANELIIAANNSGGRDNTTVIALKVDEDDAYYEVPESYVYNVMTFSDDTALQTNAEDKLLSKFSRYFDFTVPKSAREVNYIKNPFVVAVLAVAVIAGCIFLVSYFEKMPSKEFHEFTGNTSGVYLDIRTTGDDRTDFILATKDKISRLEVLRDTLKEKDIYTIPLANVQIFIEEKAGPNKFVGISSTEPVEVKLPKGEYTMTLSYPEYKILNDNYDFVDSVKLSLELSGAIGHKTILMLPEKVGDSRD